MLSLYILAVVAIGCVSFACSQIEKTELRHPDAIIESKKFFVIGLIWLIIGTIGLIGASREIFDMAMSGYEPGMSLQVRAEHDLGNILMLYLSCAAISMGAPIVLIIGSFRGWNIKRKFGFATWLSENCG